MAKLKVRELAEELNISNDDVKSFLASKGVEVKEVIPAWMKKRLQQSGQTLKRQRHQRRKVSRKHQRQK